MEKAEEMRPDDLAKWMRERALLIEGNENFDETSLKNFHQVEAEKAKKRKRLEDLKRLYFNAGRWVGGARDHSAREAYKEMLARENR